VDDYRNWDSYQTVDRETVERIAPQVTGGEQVPDEESINWVFQWEGNPPQNND
jgi:(2Fe-2S) ferredoxin